MKRNEQPKETGHKCFCPYCEEELIVSESPLCQGCGAELAHCRECGAVLEKESVICHECGADVAK